MQCKHLETGCGGYVFDPFRMRSVYKDSSQRNRCLITCAIARGFDESASYSCMY